MSLARQCPPSLAKTITELLVGERDAALPHSERPIHAHFALRSIGDALEEFDQVYQLPESERLRDLMERMGEDR